MSEVCTYAALTLVGVVVAFTCTSPAAAVIAMLCAFRGFQYLTGWA